MQVAVFCPLARTFTYLWPQTLGVPLRGIRVRVPFGRGRRLGVVLKASAEAPPEGVEPKVILDRLDVSPLYCDARLKWLERAARYYLACPGEMYETAFAWTRGDDRQRWHCPDRQRLGGFDPDLAASFGSRSTLSVRTLATCPAAPPFLHHRLARAAEAGLIERVVSPLGKDRSAGFASEPVPRHLLPEQIEAVDSILGASGFSPFLLFGPTGSGKTEVYLRAAIKTIQAGGQVMILVPEIGLTPQWLGRLRARLPDVAVWHSGLGVHEKNRVRHQLNDIKVLIGTRSAVFLPLPRLSLVIVDEEHDTSFKQGEGVCYSGRDLAVLLAQQLDIPIVLGSATPSLESWRLARKGTYTLLSLTRNIGGGAPVRPGIVDMRGVEGPVTDELIEALRLACERGEQALLYLNRRGYAPALICAACGHVPECPACSLRLTLHRRRRQVRCHACGYIHPVPAACERCGEDALLPAGEGTEKVEDQLRARLPGLRFARLDRDTVGSGTKLIRILEAFNNGRLDCLIGTQMVVKGHHFPNVTLVGVVNADQGLSLPDFRAGERWWQQLTQVLGRTGRGPKPSRVIIQTRNPSAPWLHRLGSEHSEDFLNEELGIRESMAYPPFGRWIRMVFSSRDLMKARRAVQLAADTLAAALPEIHRAGPMPCPIERLAGRYRFEIILRDDSRRILPWKLENILKNLPVPPGVRRKVDVDPVDMM